MIEALEKLRELATGSHSYLSNSRVLENVAEIEREISERYMLLPVDANGVPIRVGDNLVHIHNEHENGEVRGIVGPDEIYLYNSPLHGHVAAHMCRHFKPRTVEDVLEELLDEPDWEQSPDSYEDIKRRMIAKYAAELQMRGDEE